MNRLKERIVSFDGYDCWEQLVRTARYKGKSVSQMSDTEYQWCRDHIRGLSKSSTVRLWKGFAFLFMGDKGHARTLVTVIPVVI